MEIQKTITQLEHLQGPSRLNTSRRVDLTQNRTPSHSPVTRDQQQHLTTHHQNHHQTQKRNPTLSQVTLNKAQKHLQSEWLLDYELNLTPVEVN